MEKVGGEGKKEGGEGVEKREEERWKRKRVKRRGRCG